MNCANCGTPLVDRRCPNCAPGAAPDASLDDARKKLEETRERLGAWRERLSKRLDEFQKKRDVLAAADSRRLARAPTARLDDDPLASDERTPLGTPDERGAFDSTLVLRSEAAAGEIPGAGRAWASSGGEEDPLGLGDSGEPAESTVVLGAPPEHEGRAAQPASLAAREPVDVDPPTPAPVSFTPLRAGLGEDDEAPGSVRRIDSSEPETLPSWALTPGALPVPSTPQPPQPPQPPPAAETPRPWYSPAPDSGAESSGSGAGAAAPRPWYAPSPVSFAETVISGDAPQHADGAPDTSTLLDARPEGAGEQAAADASTLFQPPPDAAAPEAAPEASLAAIAGETASETPAALAMPDVLPEPLLAGALQQRAPMARRLGAFLLDLLLLFVVPAVILTAPVAWWALDTTLADLWGRHPVPLVLLSAAEFVLLVACYLGAFGRTPGGRLTRVRVVTHSGANPGFARALLRALLLPLSALPGAETLLGSVAVPEP